MRSFDYLLDGYRFAQPILRFYRNPVGAGFSAPLLPFAMPSTNRPNNAVPESRQEAERRCCGEGRLAWMPNEACRAMDGPFCRPSEQHRSEGS